MKATGITLILIGILLTIFTAVTYFTKEKVIDIGQLHVTREQPHYIYWSPVVGLVLAGVGGVLLWKSGKSA
jgi:hypothetical protein